MFALTLVMLAAAPLTTVAETSGWTRTGRLDEVERLCADFPKRYPGKVKCERYGTTPQGRPMLALIASADGTFTPEAIRRKSRPVVLLQGGIHAGEIDGKDAGFWLLREVLDGTIDPGALSKVTLVFVPVFNVDGHERFGPNNRPNQRGPEAMGWRVTSQNLNLNRDFAKADAPEMRAQLTFMHRFDPIMFVDLHVTDGAKFQHDVSVVFEPRRIGDPALQAFGRTIDAELFARLREQGHLPVNFYPAFDDADDPQSGFTSDWPPIRFNNAYWAQHHRFGVLVETHSWRTYPERVKATFDVCAKLLELAAAHGADWLAAAKTADANAMTLGGTEVILGWKSTGVSEPIDFQGYAYTRTKSEVSGKWWVQYDETRPQVWKVPLRDEVTPRLTIRAPKAGYVIDAPAAPAVIDRLRAHGLRFVDVKKPRVMQGERFRGTAALRPSSMEGRQPAQITGDWSGANLEVHAGALFVPIAQPHAELVMQLLEPTAPDSFASWGFFNAHFEQKEYLEDYLTEPFAREQLKDPDVKRRFEAALKDPAFANDPSARLQFFERLHPSFDPAFGVLPIFRVDSAP